MAKATNRTRDHEPIHAPRAWPGRKPTAAEETAPAARGPISATGTSRVGAAAKHPATERSGRRVVRTPVALPGEDVPPGRPSGQPRRFLTTLFFLLIVVGMLLLGRYAGAQSRAAAPRPSVAAPAEHAGRVTPRPSATSAAARAQAGTSGQFAYVGGFGPVLGASGPIHRFRVAVEKPSPAPAGADFAHEVDRTLGDRRSWIASGTFRLQRVPGRAHAEFTIYLASPRTSERMCSTGGLETGGYTSCRLPGKVIINDARWEGAVRGYRAPVSTYRQYAIDHEVGHQLGHGHEACPGKGRPAPVMMQQTLGLKGCVANAWPYLSGKRYAGPPTR